MSTNHSPFCEAPRANRPSAHFASLHLMGHCCCFIAPKQRVQRITAFGLRCKSPIRIDHVMHNSSRMHSQQPLFACPAEGPYHHAGYVVGVRWSQVVTKCTVGCQTDPLVINGCWDLPEGAKLVSKILE